MEITLRRIKGSKLTHNELDDNFEVLSIRIAAKANASHTHSITHIMGLEQALAGKIDIDEVNVPNGLLMLDATGKIPQSMIPANGCDCQSINNRLNSLEQEMPNKAPLVDGKIPLEYLPATSSVPLRNVRTIATDDNLMISDDVIFIEDAVKNFSLNGTYQDGKTITIQRLSPNGLDVDFGTMIRLMGGVDAQVWPSEAMQINLIYHAEKWCQI